MREVQQLDQGSLMGLLESLLLVSSDAVPAKTLAEAAGAPVEDVTEALKTLSAGYADANRGIQLREVAGGWRLFTHPAHHDAVEAYVLSWDRRKLSQAALETLAVITYHQPVSREGVRAVRGVSSDGVIASLKEKGLVRDMGKDARQAQLFGTTTRFLETFGLRSLDDLPPLEEFAPDEESRAFIREMLSGTAEVMPLEEMADDLDEERELFAEVDGSAADGGVAGGGVASGGAAGGSGLEGATMDGGATGDRGGRLLSVDDDATSRNDNTGTLSNGDSTVAMGEEEA